MMGEPEILPAGDIPPELEAQEALVARLEHATGEPSRSSGYAVSTRKPTGKGRSQSLTPIAKQTPRPTRDARGRIIKGSTSLNPGGKTAIGKEIQRYAELHCMEAIDFLVNVMRDPIYRTQDRIEAAKELIRQGHGLAKGKSSGEDEGGKNTTVNVLVINGQRIEF